MVKFRNRAEVDFGSLTQGRLFLFGDGIYEKFEDDVWTNAVCLEGGSHSHGSGHRCNFCLDTKVIPLSEVYIDYEIQC